MITKSDNAENRRIAGDNSKKVGRPKGTKKSGGRRKGTPNKVTKTLRCFVSELIDANREQITADLNELEPRERLQIIEKFMQYVIPKQNSQNIDITNITDEQITAIVDNIELNL